MLVVGTRSRRADENAVVLSRDGSVVASARLGDGIEHVLATASGEVWVGYFGYRLTLSDIGL